MKEQQTPRDKVLWILGSSDGKLSISRLRQQTGLPKAELDSIIEGLERENKIIIRGNKRKTIFLKL
jgi:DNA-binding IclR family transcriptional regulator